MKSYMLTWVGFASTPLLFNKRQNCHAVLPRLLFDSSITTAFNSPRPLTSLTRGALNARIPERNFSPRSSARSDRRSSMRMSRAVVAMAHPNGFLQGIRKRRLVHGKGLLPPIRTSVFSRLDAEHNLLVSQHGRHGVHCKTFEGHIKQQRPLLTATSESLSEQNDVRTNVLVITGKQFTSSAQTLHAKVSQLELRDGSGRAYGLYFVADQ